MPTLTQLVRRWDVGLSTCPWPLFLPPREVSEVCGGVINSPLPGREEGSSGKWSASLVTATCSCGAQVLLPMCGEGVRGVAGGRAAVWAQGKGQGQEDARPGHPDDADATVCARGACAGRAAVAPDRRLVSALA